MKEQFRPRLSPDEMKLIKDYRDGKVREREEKHIKYDYNFLGEEIPVGHSFEKDGVWVRRRLPEKDRRVLVIGDLHSPFVRKDYFNFCRQIRDRYKTNHTVFIGDVLDNHYMSFWDTDPDGLSSGDELDMAIEELQKWHEEFPNADVTLGNHDVRLFRQMFKAGISKRWLRRFSDVLNTPSWNFVNQIEYDNVIYTHGGRGGAINGAINRAIKRGKSIVQGHHHTASYIKFHVTDVSRIFGMQVGCGIDEDSYASAYAKSMISRFIVSAGVILDDGNLPIIEPMRL